jgi:uncharacterized integral membrane protein
MRFIYLIVILAFAFFFVTFAFENPYTVSLKYYGYLSTEIPLYILVFGAFLIGVFVAALLGAVDKIRMTLRVNKLYRKIDDLEQKNLSLLRSSQQPLPPSHPGSMI